MRPIFIWNPGRVLFLLLLHSSHSYEAFILHFVYVNARFQHFQLPILSARPLNRRSSSITAKIFALAAVHVIHVTLLVV